MLKRVTDIFIALLALLLLSPVFLILSAAILLDTGQPVLFSQERVGQNGIYFRCHKFRSMFHGARTAYKQDGSTLASENDQRITRTGRVLRKYSLDELPQLWNVLLGAMSIVGPRPDLPVHWESYTQDQRRRYTVKPGITGLAQVNGRNSLTVEQKINYDLTYIDNYSLLLDLKILVKTLVVVFYKQNIYN